MSDVLNKFVVHKVKTHMKTDIESLSPERLLRLVQADSNFWDLWMNQYCPFDRSCEFELELFDNVSEAKTEQWFPLEAVTFKTLSLHTRGILVETGQPIYALLQERYIAIQMGLQAKERERELLIEQDRAARAIELQRMIDEKDKKVKAVQSQIKLDLLENFAHAVTRINSGSDYEIEQLFQQEVLADFVQGWAREKLGLNLDSEQALAAAEVTNHTKVNARAGSGKTTVMCVRSALLIDLCSVKPSEIMMLAFNRSAAKELEDRMKKYLFAMSHPEHLQTISTDPPVNGQVLRELADQTSIQIPWVMTFDSLAKAVVEGDEGKEDQRTFIENEEREVTSIILEHLGEPTYRHEFKEVMMANFRDEWDDLMELEASLTLKEKDLLSKSLPRETFRGERVKSAGEKAIADFLFERGVTYIYEKNIRIGGRKYKPDFALENQEQTLFIEYAGLLSDENYERVFREKTEAMKTADFRVLVLVPLHIADDSFKERIIQFLQENEFEVPENPKSPEDYWDEYLEAKFKRRFIAAVKSFVDRIRQSREGAQDYYSRRIGQLEHEDPVAHRFTKLAWKVYEKYSERLRKQHSEDFKDVLQRAIGTLSSGSRIAKRKGSTIELARLRYLSLDEYQDFSELYDALVRALHSLAPKSKLFAVGDHWQSINAFMGASTALFEGFEQDWPGVRTREITFNYRSSLDIVAAGNHLMETVEGSPSKFGADLAGQVWLMDYDDLVQSPAEVATRLGNEEVAITRLLRKILADDPSSSVALLSRKNSIAWWYQGKNSNSFDNDLQDYLNLILTRIDSQHHSRISIQTVHKYKGLEADRVILLDALDVAFPLIHSDWRFSKLFGESLSRILAEERRVFYVAITRAKRDLYILTRSSRPSGFINDLRIKSTTWALFPPLADGVTLICSGKSTFWIKDYLQRAGFAWHALNKEWFLDITEFAADMTYADLLKSLRLSNRPWVRIVRRTTEVSVFLELGGVRSKVSW